MRSRPNWVGRAALTGVTVLSGALGVSALGVHAARADSSFTLARTAGADRYATAGAFDRAAFTSGVATVYLGDGLAANNADVLAAPGWGGINSLGALLTNDTNTVPSNTMVALSDNHVHSIRILGGPAAVPTAQQNALASAGYSVTRLYNQDGCTSCTRYDTMRAIDDLIPPAQVGSDSAGRRTAVLASGDATHDIDAQSAGGPAYARHLPVILTSSTSASLVPQAQEVISRLGIQHLIVVGGTSAVPASQYSPKPTGITAVDVESGPDRSATSQAFSDFALAQAPAWVKDSSMELARGDDPADALASAPYAGVQGWPICVTLSPTGAGSCAGTSTLASKVGFAKEHAATLHSPPSSTAAGGTSALADATVSDVQQAGGGRPFP